MDCDDNNIQGNLSTIILFIYIIISPYIESLGITQSMFAEVCFAIIGLSIAVWSAYNPNTLKVFGNNKTDCQCMQNTETVLNDEYVTDITDENEGC